MTSSTPPPEKPKFPEGASTWWRLKTSELTDEQLRIKREYSSAYMKWRRSTNCKLSNKEFGLAPSAAWFNLPNDQLTEEQKHAKAEYRKLYYEYNKEHLVEQHRLYQAKVQAVYKKSLQSK